MLVWTRSTIYWLGMAVLTPLFFFLGILAVPLPCRLRHRMITLWTPITLAWLRLSCGLRYEVIGRENIPDHPSVIACKHQSAWETLALQVIFPAQVWVLKKELLWIPFFGWGLALTSPIAIDRKARAQAAQQLIEQGRDRIQRGFWIVIFPEGTRVPAGKRGKYKLGGAKLAKDLNVPIVPVAHNAGEFWPRNAYCKHAGTITVVIGQPLMPDPQRSSDVTMKAIEHWIENQQYEISGVGPHADPDDRARHLASRVS